MIILVSGGMAFAIMQETIYLVYNRRVRQQIGSDVGKVWLYVP